MSELDNAIKRRVRWIVQHEHRSFSYLDLLNFTSNGKTYSLKHGTIRNKLSMLQKQEIIELFYHSGIAFYTLKGVNLDRRRKCNHMRVSHHYFHDLLRDLPLGQRCVHDIRLEFRAQFIWNVVSKHATLINPYSKDISLPDWQFDGATIKTTIHRSNAVTIIVACSSTPIPLDFDGILRLSNCLSVAKEGIQRYVDRCCTFLGHFESFRIIPGHMNWNVLMWHFGADALTGYSGKTFCLTWKVAQNILIRVYTKKTGRRGLRIRMEKQEYPRKRLVEIIQEKLSDKINY